MPSAAGRAWATLPPSVATLRTCGPPTTPQLSAKAAPCRRTKRIGFDVAVRHRRSEHDPVALLVDLVEVLDRRHIHQGDQRGVISLLQVEDQIRAAGHKLGIVPMLRPNPQRFGDRSGRVILFPEGHGNSA